MESWDEIKTAYHVARMGTVSGAAEVLGVHHATVIRHIDALEKQLGVKLFQRHARGYKATEAGDDLLRVAQATDDQFSQLAGRIKGRGAEVSGEIVLTSLASLAPQVTPILADFQREHPALTVRYLTDDRLFRLEYGEAHVAIRAGRAPEQPDNVVQKLVDMKIGAYAHKNYVAAHGLPKTAEAYAQHRFIGPDDPESRAPHYVWLREKVPAEAVTFRCSDTPAAAMALLAGAGVGFLSQAQAAAYPDLIEVHHPIEAWTATLWLVTHVDLHRTTKVQALLTFLKDHVRQGIL